MCKITNKKSNITPYGGLFFTADIFNKKGVKPFIDKLLGSRSYNAKFTYSDLVISLLYNNLCCGSFLSDLNLLKERLPKSIQNHIPSPDTVEYCAQELKTQNTEIVTENNIKHQININPKINKLLPELAVKLGLIDPNSKDLTLDFDHVILENNKQDAKKNYKFTKGYSPCFANIGDFSVYYENKNGNSPAKFLQKETLERCFENLTKNQIKINNFRADSASYQKEVIDLLEENVNFFYIRNTNFQALRTVCIAHKTWKEVEINYEKKQVTSISFTPFKGEKEYRFVVTRSLINKDKEELFEEEKYSYSSIITNDLISSDLAVITFYNQRGDVSENYNKNLINDFNISRLPFMDLNTNTVYIGFMLLSGILFEWIKKIMVKNKVKGIEIQHRVKRVFFTYISVCAKLIKHARENTIVIYSNTVYQNLQI